MRARGYDMRYKLLTSFSPYRGPHCAINKTFAALSRAAYIPPPTPLQPHSPPTLTPPFPLTTPPTNFAV